jgi:hypothetical protein
MIKQMITQKNLKDRYLQINETKVDEVTAEELDYDMMINDINWVDSMINIQPNAFFKSSATFGAQKIGQNETKDELWVIYLNEGSCGPIIKRHEVTDNILFKFKRETFDWESPKEFIDDKPEISLKKLICIHTSMNICSKGIQGYYSRSAIEFSDKAVALVTVNKNQQINDILGIVAINKDEYETHKVNAGKDEDETGIIYNLKIVCAEQNISKNIKNLLSNLKTIHKDTHKFYGIFGENLKLGSLIMCATLNWLINTVPNVGVTLKSIPKARWSYLKMGFASITLPESINVAIYTKLLTDPLFDIENFLRHSSWGKYKEYSMYMDSKRVVDVVSRRCNRNLGLYNMFDIKILPRNIV